MQLCQSAKGVAQYTLHQLRREDSPPCRKPQRLDVAREDVHDQAEMVPVVWFAGLDEMREEGCAVHWLARPLNELRDALQDVQLVDVALVVQVRSQPFERLDRDVVRVPAMIMRIYQVHLQLGL